MGKKQGIEERIEALEKKRKLKWYDAVFLSALVLVLVLSIVGIVYTLWDAATTKMSAEVECTVRQIDYVTLTDENGTGSCVFPLVEGNVTMCALPRDVQCHGVVQDFPLVKALVGRR